MPKLTRAETETLRRIFRADEEVRTAERHLLGALERLALTQAWELWDRLHPIYVSLAKFRPTLENAGAILDSLQSGGTECTSCHRVFHYAPFMLAGDPLACTSDGRGRETHPYCDDCAGAAASLEKQSRAKENHT